jgi:hypothetical protein
MKVVPATRPDTLWPMVRPGIRPTTQPITGWRRDALTGAAIGALVFLCAALLFGAYLL